MATHDMHLQSEQRQDCFLCTLDPKHTCSQTSLEGRIVAVHEHNNNGERTPLLLLDTGTQRVEVHLDDTYYRSLIKELKARAEVLHQYNLTARIYHLPNTPEQVTYRNRTRLRYRGNAYTLAVLEPDILLNITDLNQAEYCPRQYHLNRLLPSTTSSATIRGNLVHHCFKELLKEHDRGQLHSPLEDEADSTPRRTALASMQEHLEQALDLQSIDMALSNVSRESMRAEVQPHLASLAAWFERERTTLWDMPASYNNPETSGNQVRAETFLLAPEIGLRGRLDLFWQHTGQQRLLELKTGGATGELPRREHRWQVYGYHALLTVRRDSHMKRAMATLLYSGTPGSAQAFGIPATIREIQRVNERRNLLVLSRATGIPAPPPGPFRCTKCSMLEQCQHVSALLQWQPPEPDLSRLPQENASVRQQGEGLQNSASGLPGQASPARIIQAEDREFFAKYYELLHIEGRAGEEQQALLWTLPVSERLERGTAIQNLQLQGAPRVEKDGWEMVFRCTNTSELREGDEILLSDGNPIAGEVVTGTIMSSSSEQVTVWMRELIAHPALIDRYDNDLVHVRTLQNLMRWQYVPSHLRDLVAGAIRPRFREQQGVERPDFNSEQNLAVTRALQMQDYLLIHGPPGTGKTSVIAEIVRRLVGRGERVLLAAFTNQAVDNMLKRLDREGFSDYLRLGHERSVADPIRPHLLKELLTASEQALDTVGGEATKLAPDSFQIDTVRKLLSTTPVVASTSATWSSDKYSAKHTGSEQQEGTDLFFDVAIIDEAGQLTLPAILGALRFARRFILVGDEKQLPPLVLSKEAAEAGLADSLFSFLKRRDDDYVQNHLLSVSACVPLRTQYRMNKWIAHFSSTVFYNGQLLAHPSIASRRLAYSAASMRTEQTRAHLAREELCVAEALHPNFPLVFLDTREEGEQIVPKQSNAEARAIRSLVAGLLMRGIAAQDIGVIALYRAQVANIRRHLFSADPAGNYAALPGDTSISVDTVDRFQGGERMVIILSFATVQEPAAESAQREFLLNANRLNVALTRAQRKLILVGSVPALENLTLFSRLLTYCRSMKTLISYSVRTGSREQKPNDE